jgi:ADP-ribose pyrophosphatase YjhB (NUDIX family)
MVYTHFMNTIPDFAVTVRALIVDQGELFMVKHDPKFNYYALAGGKLEAGESLADAMARELLEETTVTAEVGSPVIVNEWVSATDHRIEFFFWIKNAADFRKADPSSATHGFELAAFAFGDPADSKFQLRPDFLREKFAKIAELGNDYPLEIVRSY